MTHDERIKKLRTAAAVVAVNPLVPAEVREAFAVLVNELAELGERLDKLERNLSGGA